MSARQTSKFNTVKFYLDLQHGCRCKFSFWVRKYITYGRKDLKLIAIDDMEIIKLERKNLSKVQQLEGVIPKWKKEGKATCAPPGITTAEVKGPLQEEQKNWDKSLFHPPTRVATKEEERLMIGLVVEQAIISLMENSCYQFNGEMREQTSGLATGEDISRCVARVVMLDWDRKVTELAELNNLKLYFHGRYVDDAEEAGKALPAGTRWMEGPWIDGFGGKLVLVEDLVQSDLEIPADARTMTEFIKMGSTINPDIQLTGDCPSLNLTGMMPALNTHLYVNSGKVMFQNYRKPMANLLMMMKNSAMPEKVKRASES